MLYYIVEYVCTYQMPTTLQASKPLLRKSSFTALKYLSTYMYETILCPGGMTQPLSCECII